MCLLPHHNSTTRSPTHLIETPLVEEGVDARAVEPRHDHLEAAHEDVRLHSITLHWTTLHYSRAAARSPTPRRRARRTWHHVTLHYTPMYATLRDHLEAALGILGEAHLVAWRAAREVDDGYFVVVETPNPYTRHCHLEAPTSASGARGRRRSAASRRRARCARTRARARRRSRTRTRRRRSQRAPRWASVVHYITLHYSTLQ